MLLPYGAMIKNDVIEAFNAAVTNPENINSSGGINWNFVDSDLQIGLGVIYNSDYLNDCFAVLVDRYFA
jgi:hypothetical protein